MRSRVLLEERGMVSTRTFSPLVGGEVTASHSAINLPVPSGRGSASHSVINLLVPSGRGSASLWAAYS